MRAQSLTEPAVDVNTDRYSLNSTEDNPNVDSALTMIEQPSLGLPDSLEWLRLEKAKALLLAEAHRHEEISSLIGPAIQFAERRRMNLALVDLYNVLAVGQTYRGEYSAALRSYHHIIPLMYQDSIKRIRPDVFNNIGTLYLKIRDIEAAVRYFRNANEIAPNPASFLNIALAYAELDSQEQTLIHIKNGEALIHRTSAQFRDEMMLHFVYGKLYLNQNTDSAKARFYKSLLLAKKEGDRRMEAENLVNLARCYAKQNDFEETMQALRSAEFIAEENGFNEILLDLYRQFIQLFKISGKKTELAHYQSQFISKKETLYNAELSRELALTESRILERRNTEILAHQQEELSVQNEILGYQEWITSLAIGVTRLSLMLLGSILFDLYHRHVVTYSLERKVKERIRLFHNEKSRANKIKLEREDKLKEIRLRTLGSISAARVNPDGTKNELEDYLHSVRAQLGNIRIGQDAAGVNNIEYIDHD